METMVVFIVMFEGQIMRVFSNWRAASLYMADYDWDRVIVEYAYEDA